MATAKTTADLDARPGILEIFARAMGRFVPDAITASVILLLILAGMAITKE